MTSALAVGLAFRVSRSVLTVPPGCLCATHARGSWLGRPLLGLGDPSTFWMRTATSTGLASPGYAASSGFSRPPDALIPSAPFRLCFTPVTPLGFLFWTFRVFPPPVARRCSHARSQSSRRSPAGARYTHATFPPCRWLRARRATPKSRSLRLVPDFEGFGSRRIRSLRVRCYPGSTGRYSPGLVLFEVFPRWPWPPGLPVGLLSWAWA